MDIGVLLLAALCSLKVPPHNTNPLISGLYESPPDVRHAVKSILNNIWPYKVTLSSSYPTQGRSTTSAIQGPKRSHANTSPVAVVAHERQVIYENPNLSQNLTHNISAYPLVSE